jgi:hypothetical protein
MPCNITEEQRSKLHRGGSMESSKTLGVETFLNYYLKFNLFPISEDVLNCIVVKPRLKCNEDRMKPSFEMECAYVGCSLVPVCGPYYSLTCFFALQM